MNRALLDMAVILLAAAFVLLAMVWCAHAAEWQLMRALPGESYKPRGNVLSAETACRLDLASDANIAPPGTRLRCDRITDSQEARR